MGESNEPKPLYEDSNYCIVLNPREDEGHDIWIGGRDTGDHSYFARGTLRGVAEDVLPEQLEGFLGNYDGRLPVCLSKRGLSLEGFAFACARARISELEEELSVTRNDLMDALLGDD